MREPTHNHLTIEERCKIMDQIMSIRYVTDVEYQRVGSSGYSFKVYIEPNHKDTTAGVFAYKSRPDADYLLFDITSTTRDGETTQRHRDIETALITDEVDAVVTNVRELIETYRVQFEKASSIIMGGEDVNRELCKQP